MSLPKDLLDVLACPACKTPLTLRGDTGLLCASCHRLYPIRDGIPVLLVHEATIEESNH